jgi:hypothetical protein
MWTGSSPPSTLSVATSPNVLNSKLSVTADYLPLRGRSRIGPCGADPDAAPRT